MPNISITSHEEVYDTLTFYGPEYPKGMTTYEVAGKLGMTNQVDTVRRYLKALEEKGWATHEVKRPDDGRRYPISHLWSAVPGHADDTWGA